MEFVPIIYLSNVCCLLNQWKRLVYPAMVFEKFLNICTRALCSFNVCFSEQSKKVIGY